MRCLRRLLPALFLVAACAEAGVEPDGGDDPADAAAAFDVSPVPDGAAKEPDASIGTPDAKPPTPDAAVPPPDAAVPPPDAIVPPPDAMVVPPDATPLPDAFVLPDATPLPDAFVPPDAPIGTPDAPTGDCNIMGVDLYTDSTVTPIADLGTTNVTMTVSGSNPYIARLGLRTSITHTYAADLDITLISPAGTRVLLTSDNGATADDVYNGTLWSDFVNTPVIHHVFTSGVTATELTPESAMAAFQGEDPNGTWTLEIVDDAFIDTGTISSWTLEVAALPTTPVYTTHVTTATPGTTIPDLTTVTEVIGFGSVPTELCDLHLTTNITHTYNGDLDLVLISPAGTRVQLSTGNGGSTNDIFNGTLWDDTANLPISEATFTTGVTETPLTAESALGAFIGENPNGLWSLEITDNAGGDVGTLVSWSLDPLTCTCP